MKRLMVAINKLPHLVQIVIAPVAEQAQAKTAEMILQYESALLQNDHKQNGTEQMNTVFFCLCHHRSVLFRL